LIIIHFRYVIVKNGLFIVNINKKKFNFFYQYDIYIYIYKLTFSNES
jgi:hypothetical protein